MFQPPRFWWYPGVMRGYRPSYHGHTTAVSQKSRPGLMSGTCASACTTFRSGPRIPSDPHAMQVTGVVTKGGICLEKMDRTVLSDPRSVGFECAYIDFASSYSHGWRIGALGLFLQRIPDWACSRSSDLGDLLVLRLDTRMNQTNCERFMYRAGGYVGPLHAPWAIPRAVLAFQKRRMSGHRKRRR